MTTTIPQLETERLYLRGMTPADIPAYQKYFVDYEIIRYLNSNVPWPYPEDGVQKYMDEQIFPFQGKTKWLWCIFLKEDPDHLIGAIELFRQGKPENRGFWLARPYQGRGYMTEAAEATTDFAFDVLGFEKLIFSNATQNSKSGRVKIKTGARLLSTKPSKYVDPTLTESQIWELTKEEWTIFKNNNKKFPDNAFGASGMTMNK